MKDGANMKKKNWVKEVSEQKMAAVLIMQVEQVGLCLFPLKSKCVVFGVVCGAGISFF